MSGVGGLKSRLLDASTFQSAERDGEQSSRYPPIGQ